MEAIGPRFSTLKLLKFCYLLMALVILSCGDNTSKSEINEIESNSSEATTENKETASKTILCFGDSITAGYGLDDTTDAYPALIQQKIDSLDLNYNVLNSGLSGETSAGGRNRIDWILRQDVSVFILELGANDGLRGVPLSETRQNLQAIIDAVKAKGSDIEIILAGMQLPPNMGQEYTSEFRWLFKNLAEKNNIAFIPFILENVGGIAELNQSDGIHPNVKGHKIVAENVWDVLYPIIKK